MARQGARSALRHFLSSEAAGGIVLIAAAALALVVANGPLAESYFALLNRPVGPALTAKLGPMTPLLWINDGLMALFFLLVGLEIKREFVDGRLTTWERRRLPILAAACGMLVPAALYLVVTAGRPDLAQGWAIPAATDIAFAIGVLALLGRRAPASLKLFVTAVAIVDDVGAVAIIALAYTAALDLGALAAAAVMLLVMHAMARRRITSLPLYLVAAAGLWLAVLLSGVHPTVAGVLAASAIPVVKTPGAPDSAASPLHRLEHGLAPLVGFCIVPLFGFANAGIAIGDLRLADLAAPLPLGIAAALFAGKAIGVFGAVRLAARLGLAPKLFGASWLQIFGACLLCGIGFTMSLFIGALAFPDRPELVAEAKIGVLAGSFAAALAGYLILRFAPPQPRRDFDALESDGVSGESVAQEARS